MHCNSVRFKFHPLPAKMHCNRSAAQLENPQIFANRKKGEEETMSAAAQSQDSSYLPDAIFFNILTRLPVISICRFKSVCKTWLSIISSPAFVHSHTALSKSKPKFLVTIYSKSSSSLFIADKAPERYLFIADPVPEQDKDGSSLVVALRQSVTMPTVAVESSLIASDVSPGDSQSVEGLIFSLCSKDLIGIANPSTNKWVALSRAPTGHGSTRRYVSLGFDPVEGKHKFLESISIHSHGNNVESTEHRVITIGDDVNSWRYVKDGPSINRGEYGGQEICINGVIYFTASVIWASRGIQGGLHGWVRCIVAFDVRTESFQAVKLSMKGRFNYSPYPWMYVEFEGKVAVVDYPLSNRDSCYNPEDCEHALELWVLEDFENQVWNLKFAALPPLPMKMDDMICPKHKLVGTTLDGELIFAVFESGTYYGKHVRSVTKGEGVLFSFLFFDMKTGDFKSSEVRFPEGFALNGNIKITAMGHVETLLSLTDASKSV